MRLRFKLIILALVIVVIPMLVSAYFVIDNVREQNYQEADLMIENTLQGVMKELSQLQADYGSKVEAFARSEKIALPTYILIKYSNYRYLDASNIEELESSIVDNVLLFNLALNFDVAEVRFLNKELIVAVENQRRIGENLITGNSPAEEITGEKKVGFVRAGDKFLLEAQAPILWKEKKVGILILKKYINEAYLATLKRAQGVNIAIIADKKPLVSTMSHSLFPGDLFSLTNKERKIIRNVNIQGEQYNFTYQNLDLNGNKVATVLVGLSTRRTSEKIANTRLILFKTTLYSLLLAIIIIIFISNGFTRPIKKMIEITNEIRKGNFDKRVDYKSNDELGELAEQFNEMAISFKEYRDDLYQLKEFQENILESIREGMIVIDTEGKIQSTNRSLAELFQIYKEDYIGKNLSELSAFRQLEDDFWKVIKEEGIFVKDDFHYQTQEGSKIFNLKIYPLTNREREIYGAVIILEEISRKVELEKQLLLNDKLSSIGRFTAGIAHEINNPLGAITNFVETILYDEEDETKRNYLECIRSETERISSIVNGLLNFSRQSKSEFGIVDIREVVELALKICQYQKDYKKFKIVKEFGDDLPYVMGSFNQLQQVCVNLILNAFEAMTEGDSLEIKIKPSADKAFLEVSFTDTGTGIEPQHLQKIFDPFFTTKEEGKGVGLGLSISYGIIKNHGGDIKVDSEVGIGSTFTIRLPIYK